MRICRMMTARLPVTGTISNEHTGRKHGCFHVTGGPFLGIYLFIYSFYLVTLNTPSPSAGRVRGLKVSTHLFPVHALHFGLADWVSTPAPRQLSTNTPLTTLLSHALTLSTVRTRLGRKNPTHLESSDAAIGVALLRPNLVWFRGSQS